MYNLIVSILIIYLQKITLLLVNERVQIQTEISVKQMNFVFVALSLPVKLQL